MNDSAYASGVWCHGWCAVCGGLAEGDPIGFEACWEDKERSVAYQVSKAGILAPNLLPKEAVNPNKRNSGQPTWWFTSDNIKNSRYTASVQRSHRLNGDIRALRLPVDTDEEESALDSWFPHVSALGSSSKFAPNGTT